MMRRHFSVFGVSGIITMLALAGCLGGEESSDAPFEADAPVLFDDATGAIEGLVSDEELKPLTAATVRIVELERETLTSENGTFGFPLVPPGEHVLAVDADGFEALRVKVTVRAQEISGVTLSIGALPADVAYFEVFPYVGYESCQWYVPIGLAHCSVGYTIAYGTLAKQGVNASNYGLPADLMDNRDKYNFTARPDHTAIVSELHWQATSAAAQVHALVLACAWYDPSVDECVPPGTTSTGERYFGVVGESPIIHQWKHPKPEELPWIMSRSNVNGNTTDAKPAGVALDQRIEMWNTVFYGDEPPAMYSAGSRDA